MEKKVSVIIPMYKGNSYISHLLDMLEENWKSANKTGSVSMEMVLVNDFPAERLEIEKKRMNHVSLVKVINKQNSGIHFSRVQGLLYSSGDYILFLDQDDSISPVYIREQIAEMRDADAVICNGRNLGNLIYRNKEELDRAVEKMEYLKGSNRILSPGQVLIRKSAIPEEWVQNILIKNGADDYFLWMLMFYKNKKIKIHNKILFWHLISDINTSKDRNEMAVSVLEMLSKMRSLGFLSLEEEREIKQNRNNLNRPEIISDEKYKKEKTYKQILETWMTLRDRKISVSNFLIKMGIKKIAIYGGGILGRHLYHELKGTDITVVCFLDQNRKVNISGIKTIVPGESIDTIDAIIITPIMEYEEIREDLRKMYQFDIMSIETVIYNADCELMVDREEI